MGLSQGEDRAKGTERILEEIMAENFPNLIKETNMPKAQNSKCGSLCIHLTKIHDNQTFKRQRMLKAA